MERDLIPDVGIDDLVANPEPRCACVLLVDVSSSMHGGPIGELNRGLGDFAQEIKKDVVAAQRVEVAIITFASEVTVEQDFVTAGNFHPPTLVANGTTMMCHGINVALDLLEERKQEYNDAGIDYFRPWLLMITDGAPSEGRSEIDATADRLKEAEAKRQVAAFSVGVSGADVDLLRRISPRPPALLEGLKFSEMFAWLSRSLIRTSEERTDEPIHLEDPEGWQVVRP